MQKIILKQENCFIIQAGITAWGVKCGRANVPGAYASVVNGLCFIKWATNCVHGNKYDDYYTLGTCASFIDDEITRLEKKVFDIRGGGRTSML